MLDQILQFAMNFSQPLRKRLFLFTRYGTVFQAMEAISLG